MARMTKTRKPTLGLLLPRAKEFVESEISIKSSETPVVLCRRVGDVKIIETKPGGFTIANTTDAIVPYVAIIASKTLVNVSGMPWRDAIKMLRVAYASGMLNDKIREFFTGFKRTKP